MLKHYKAKTWICGLPKVLPIQHQVLIYTVFNH